jgi:hypothetical protein
MSWRSIYRATVTTQKGLLEAHVYETDRALRLVVTRRHSVIVLGYLGEPLIRMDGRDMDPRRRRTWFSRRSGSGS